MRWPWQKQTIPDAGGAAGEDALTKAYPAEWFGLTGFGMSVGLPGDTGMSTRYGGSEYVARLQSQDPMENTVVLAAMSLLVGSIDTIGFGVCRVGAPADCALDFSHPAAVALMRGSAGWGRSEMMWAIVEGLLVAGNAVLVPAPDGSLSCLDWRNLRLPILGRMNYEYRNPFMSEYRVYSPQEVAHLRYRRSTDGINGIGIFNSTALAELRTDREAQSYTLTLLTRMGVPGIIFTPDDPHGTNEYSRQDADSLMRSFNQNFAAGRRGSTAAITKPWKPFEPRGAAGRLDLSGIRNVSEERLLALMGTPPAMRGIGTGAQASRVGATMQAYRRIYAEHTIQPFAELLCQQMTTHLLPFFTPPGVLEFRPDYSKCLPVLVAQAMLEKDLAEARQAGATEQSSGVTQAPNG